MNRRSYRVITLLLIGAVILYFIVVMLAISTYAGFPPHLGNPNVDLTHNAILTAIHATETAKASTLTPPPTSAR
jgi:hypothetical protein